MYGLMRRVAKHAIVQVIIKKNPDFVLKAIYYLPVISKNTP